MPNYDIDSDNRVKKEIKGRVYAMVFAKNMTHDDITHSLATNPPHRRDWQPFDEGTGAFL